MREIVEMRGEYEKHWLTGAVDEDGNPVVFMKSYPVPIHMKVDGEWVDIEPRWDYSADGLTLRGAPYDAYVPHGMVGTKAVHLVDAQGSPEVAGHRLWWHGIATDTSAVLIASAVGLELHLILWGPLAPREWLFSDAQGAEGFDNIEREAKREGVEQNYELELVTEQSGPYTLKRWTGRVRAVDPDTRRRSWSDDVAYPVRIA